MRAYRYGPSNPAPKIAIDQSPECTEGIELGNPGPGHVVCGPGTSPVVSWPILGCCRNARWQMPLTPTPSRGDKIPCALIVTGTNIASQDLLFEQLSESLQQSSQSKFVRLRSSEATTLKATLKKVIRDVTDRVSAGDDDDDDLQAANGQDVCLPPLPLSTRS